jgi:GNAT superfamily N-acetyltransferase
MMFRPRVGPAAVRPAAPAEVPALAGVLARALAADPIVCWPFAFESGERPESRLARVQAMFEIIDRPFASEGWIHVAADGLGAMSLLPPGSTPREREIGEATAPAIGALTADRGARYERLWAWIDSTIRSDPRWLLDQLAVEPTAQGLGIGGAMLRFAIGCSEHDGLPLVLETAVAGNVALYEHFGFRVTLAADAPDGGPHVWFMSRDPRGTRLSGSSEALALAPRPGR